MSMRTKEAEYQLPVLGILMICGYIGFYFLWSKVNTQQYENLDLRIVACLIGLSFLLKKYWPRKLDILLPLYWYVSLAYAFPFFFTFMLLKNNGSAIWQVNAMLALTLLVILTDWLSSIVLVVIGSGFAWMAYVLTTLNPEIPYNVINGVLFDYVGVIIFGGLFIHSKDKYQLEKLEAIEMASFNVAHELRTPLAAIHAGTSILEDYLPDLFKGYNLAKQNHLAVPAIYPNQFKQLNTVLTDIKDEIYRANSVIEMLLVNARQIGVINIDNFSRCSMRDCLGEALARYPFEEDEKELIHSKIEQDFIFLGNKELTIHILFNLLKNALYYIAAARKGDITLWIEKDAKYNYLHFKDTGAGMDKDTLAHLFSRFYSKTYHGYGIGLSYCKNVMQSYSGDISCKSVKGEYAEFILKFPRIKES